MTGADHLSGDHRVPHPIEQTSRGIVESRLEMSGWTPGAREVVTRVVHATGDPDLARTMVVAESAVQAGVSALASGAPVVCDVEMVVSGVRTELQPRCWLGEVAADPSGYPTRSAAAARLAASAHPNGAIFVVGCAPTALEELCDLIEAGKLRPALVVGTPVGFVGAAESKARLREVSARTGLASITNVGERGGSAMAAAVTNALSDLAATRSRGMTTEQRVPAGAPLHSHSHSHSRAHAHAHVNAVNSADSALFLIGHGTRLGRRLRAVRRFRRPGASQPPGSPRRVRSHRACGA